MTACMFVEELSLPVVDMNDFYEGERHAIFVEQLRDAFRQYGFIAALNAHIEDEILDHGYERASDYVKSNKKGIRTLENKGLASERILNILHSH